MKNIKNKFILDVTCGGRTIWFDKKNKHTIYTDIRKEEKGFDAARPNFEVCPDEIMDYRDLKYPKNSFKLVVWDPPHIKDLHEKSWFRKKYGSLNAETWQTDINLGFKQIMKVLKPQGILIMKWSCPKGKSKRTVTLKEMLSVLPQQPLFGHTTESNSQTNWICFMKI